MCSRVNEFQLLTIHSTNAISRRKLVFRQIYLACGGVLMCISSGFTMNLFLCPPPPPFPQKKKKFIFNV